MAARFSSLDLNLLRVFVAIDRCRSVTEAGRRLALSQPATSNALARLRQAFDDALFVRAPGGLAPTPLAARLAPIVARHLEAIEAAWNEPAEFDPARSTLEWRLSLSDLGELVFLSAIVESVRREAPNMRVTNAAVAAERVADALAHREIDFAVGIMDSKQRGLRSSLLFRERYVALSRRVHPQAWRERKGFADAPLVVAAPTATDHQGIAESLVRHRLGHRIVVRARHFAAIPEIVVRGELVAIVPEMFARIACESHPLAMWPVPLATPTYDVSLVWHQAGDADPARIWLREKVLHLFRRESSARTRTIARPAKTARFGTKSRGTRWTGAAPRR